MGLPREDVPAVSIPGPHMAGVLEVKIARAGHRSCHPARVLERRMEILSDKHGQLVRAGEEILRKRNEHLIRLRGLLRASAFIACAE